MLSPTSTPQTCTTCAVRTGPPLSERHLPRPLSVIGRGAVHDPAVPTPRVGLPPPRRRRLERRPRRRAPYRRLGRPVPDPVGVESEPVADAEPGTSPARYKGKCLLVHVEPIFIQDISFIGYLLVIATEVAFPTVSVLHL